MLNFKEWLGNQSPTPTNSHEIDGIYSKAHIAVEIVDMYDPQLLRNISTIANLANGAYGLYNSGEVQKELPADMEKKMIYTGKVNKANISKIPNIMLKKYFPDFDESKIKESDTIRVNVKKILSQVKTPIEAVIQIATTIVHEATHSREMQSKGYTNEHGPEAAEHEFQQWAAANIKQIMRKYPEINLPQQQTSQPSAPQAPQQQPQSQM